MDDETSDAYAILGRTLLESGDYSEAIQPLEKAIDLYVSYSQKYDFPWVFFNIGVSHHHLGNENKAIEYVEIAAKKGHHQAMNLLKQMGRPKVLPIVKTKTRVF